MKRTTAVLLLFPALLAVSCATSTGTVDRALTEAGRQRRREQPPPTAAELRREIDSFIDNEIPLLQKKADLALAREVKVWRLTFIGGAALGVLAATSGSIESSDGALQPLLTGVGVAAVVLGGVGYFVRTPELRACKAYLSSARDDLVSFRRNAIPPGEGPVGTGVWHSWIDRVAAIRSHESCARVR